MNDNAPHTTFSLAPRRESVGDSDPNGLASPDGPPPHDRSFNGYTRYLTARGGYLIRYRDRNRRWYVTVIHVVTYGPAAALMGAQVVTGFASWASFAVPVAVIGISWLVTRLMTLRHSLEIHPEGLIVDDELFFPIDAIGENWPSLQPVDGDEDRMVVSGICGTRLITFVTAYRRSKNDRTPEVLAADLENAMEQIWGRREAMSPDE